MSCILPLPEDFDQRLIEAGLKHVYYLFPGSHKTLEQVNITALERMNLYYLQKQLVDMIEVLHKTPPDSKDVFDLAWERIKVLLHDYCKYQP